MKSESLPEYLVETGGYDPAMAKSKWICSLPLIGVGKFAEENNTVDCTAYGGFSCGFVHSVNPFRFTP
jgi:hypothetical protein